MASSTGVPSVVFNVGWEDISCYDGPVATRRSALQQSMTRYPNITIGEEVTGYS